MVPLPVGAVDRAEGANPGVALTRGDQAAGALAAGVLAAGVRVAGLLVAGLLAGGQMLLQAVAEPVRATQARHARVTPDGAVGVTIGGTMPVARHEVAR